MTQWEKFLKKLIQISKPCGEWSQDYELKKTMTPAAWEKLTLKYGATRQDGVAWSNVAPGSTKWLSNMS